MRWQARASGGATVRVIFEVVSGAQPVEQWVAALATIKTRLRIEPDSRHRALDGLMPSRRNPPSAGDTPAPRNASNLERASRHSIRAASKWGAPQAATNELYTASELMLLVPCSWQVIVWVARTINSAVHRLPGLHGETKVKKSILLLLAAILTISASVTRAQEDHAYTQGPVVIVSFIRTEPGMFEEYMRYLASTYKHLMDGYKKQGIITDYAVYQALPRDPKDADLILTVTYKNMAAFDDLQARTDPATKQVFGSLAKAASASVDREKMRKQLGSQLVRQLILK
jgi:hypothetical protein